MNKIYSKFIAFSLGLLFLQGVTLSSVSALTITESPTSFLRTQNILEPGEEKVDPAKAVTREQWVKWVLRSEDFLGDKIVREPFRDVQNNSYISSAWRNKIVKTAPRFFPKKAVTVGEAFKILYKGKKLSPKAETENVIKTWKDLPEDMEMKNILLDAVNRGLWKPISDTEIGVAKTLTRKQAAQILYFLETGKTPALTAGGATKFPTQKEKEKDLLDQKYDFIYRSIQNDFLYEDRLDTTKLTDATVKGLLDSLGDKYTEYLPAQESEQFIDQQSGQLEGIGAQLGLDEQKRVYISTVFPDTPAAKAKLQAGDILLMADGHDLTGLTTSEVATYIKGPKGTTVKITVERNGEKKEFSVVRDKIELKYVQTSRDEDILNVRVLSFGTNTAEEFRKALEANFPDSTLKGLIIDLRGNPGGSLDTVLTMLGDFLPADTIAAWEEQKDATSKLKVTSNGAPFLDIPLVVLVDRDSASASEIFAGAIQDQKRGVIIGSTPTYGKGVMQHFITFSDGSSFKYTFAYWLTPNKRSIDGVGITPDIVVTPVEGKDQVLEVGKNTIKRGKAMPKAK